MKETDKLPLIIGIGNEWRGDDAIGPTIVAQLKSTNPVDAEYQIADKDFSSLLDLWKDRDVVVIDALHLGGGNCGQVITVHSVEDLVRSPELHISTHGFGLIEALQLGQQIGEIPRNLFFVGVSGKEWGVGNALSKPVKHVIPLAVNIIQNHLESKPR